MIKEKIIILKKLSSMLEIEMPIEEALAISSLGCKNKKLKNCFILVREQVKNGDSLSNSLSQFPYLWSITVTSLIWSGELSGSLSRQIEEAAIMLEKQDEFSKKIVSALIYPCLICILSCTLIAFLLFYIYPKIIPVLISLRVPLPLSTKIILYSRDFLSIYWIYIVLTLIIGIISIFLRKKIFGVGKFLEYILGVAPIIGNIKKDIELSLISKNIGIISSTELGLVHAIDVTKQIASTKNYKAFLIDMEYAVKQGKTLSNFLRESKKVPLLWSDLILIGERSSKLSKMFIKISETHQQEVSDRIVYYSRLIEPLLMILTGLIVVFIALSIITPMYSITQFVQ